MMGFDRIARKVFGNANDRKVKAAHGIVQEVGALEAEMQTLDDAALAAKTVEFRERLAGDTTLDQLMPEAFAVVREAAQRVLGMRPFDVQIIGAMILHQGKIAEMKTGEGKTLAATMPVYLNALEGKGVHVVTVNDYLASRDAEWMGQIYRFLGMTVGVIVPGLDDNARREAYACDITYGTNNELGFDYLRDNMKYALDQMTQRGHHYAIVDEVDSILIDEARTPLIISGPTEDQSEKYIAIDKLIPHLRPEHYEVDEKQRTVVLTEEGNEFVEEKLVEAGLLEEGTSIYDPGNISHVHHVNQALRAHKLFQRDKDYIVRNDKVVIIDEFTGRMMEGRRYGDGLHQALEAKEAVKIEPENQTLASVTFQNYFRLYEKLAGMTGTALTEAGEFMEIYGLDVLEIPTNKPVVRKDDDDQVFRTSAERDNAVVEAIREGQKRGQPILVGTTTIEKSELFAAKLKKLGIEHRVLNARYHEQEAQIIAQAGAPGHVTIATNMAGRGTDIKLGGNAEARVEAEAGEDASAEQLAEIKARIEVEIDAGKETALTAGGLWVVATERHESRRIDNQLRGRSGRQGDPGQSSFFISLDDDLMRIFGSDRIDSMLQKLGLEEGEAIIHPWVNKAIQKAQGKVEARNFDIRKNLLKYDDVMNDQRKAIFSQRREFMEADDLSESIRDMRHQAIDDLVDEHMPKRAYADQWKIEDLQEKVTDILGTEFPLREWADEEGADDETIREQLFAETDRLYAEKEEKAGSETMRNVEKQLLLQVLDKHWREHLIMLDHLRSVIHLRGYAQKDPLNEYKSEAFQLFEALLASLRVDVTRQLGNVRILTEEEQAERQRMMAEFEARMRQQMEAQTAQREAERAVGAAALTGAGAESQGGRQAAATSRQNGAADPNDPENWGKVSRNAPCPCGSGRKYKHCHGRAAA